MNNIFKPPRLIGHRGVKDLKPENTLESISKAFDLGLGCVEIDVKISKDNIPIVLHDDTLDRTTNGSGLVCDFTFEEINKLDAGYFFYKTKTDIKVPSLRSVLELVNLNQKYVNIELKPNNGYEILNVKKTLEEVKKYPFQKVFFSSFNLKSCIYLKENFPNFFCGFLNDNFDEINTKDTIDICKKYNFFSCGINYNIYSKSLVEEFNKNNIKINIYSDKNLSPKEAEHLWNNKVTSIFIDDPSDYI